MFDDFPYHQSVLHRAEGEYEPLPGFHEELGDCRSEEELPENARAYLERIESVVGVPIALVGVGPGRDQVIWTGAAAESAVGAPGLSAA